MSHTHRLEAAGPTRYVSHTQASFIFWAYITELIEPILKKQGHFALLAGVIKITVLTISCIGVFLSMLRNLPTRPVTYVPTAMQWGIMLFHFDAHCTAVGNVA